MKTKTFLVIILVLTAIWLGGCSSVPTTNVATVEPVAVSSSQTRNSGVVAEGRLLPLKNTHLAFAAGGRVVENGVKEGQSVSEGQVLALLEGSEQYEAQEAAAGLEVVQVEQALEKLDDDVLMTLAQAGDEFEKAQKAFDEADNGWNGKTAAEPSAFDAAIEDYVDAEKDVEDAQKELNDQSDKAVDAPAREQAAQRLEREQTRLAEMTANLLQSYEDPQYGAETETRTTLLKAIARLEAARLRLDKLNGGADPDVKAVLEARLKSARSAQAAAKQALNTLELRAPWSGNLAQWDLEMGDVVNPGQTVGYLADTGAWVVETTDLTENGVVSIQVGSAATITVDAMPGKTFTGKVLDIEGRGEKNQGDMTYRVRIQLDQNDPLWYWNMNVKVNID